MSFPAFYDPARVGQLYKPDVLAATNAGRDLDIAPAEQDEERVVLLLVDMQVDFVHEDGALSVPGAVEDARRTIEWIYQHLDRITTLAASLDSHVPIQIFSPSWWLDADGHQPQPYTPISRDDVESGQWRPLYEPDWSREYVARLEADAKKQLMIWPYHTLIGTPGHTLTPALYEAIAYHSAARRTQPRLLNKGSIPKTEHYSIMEPEIKVPDAPLGTLNTDFLDLIGSYDKIYVAGQAKSHCVLETVTSMVRYYERPTLEKMRIIMDQTSSVVHPEIDFEAITNETLARYEQQGLKLINTAEAL